MLHVICYFVGCQCARGKFPQADFARYQFAPFIRIAVQNGRAGGRQVNNSVHGKLPGFAAACFNCRS